MDARVGRRPNAQALVGLLRDALAACSRRAPGSIAPETRMLDLDLDSLGFVSVLARIEAACDVRFSADDTLALLEAATVDDLARALEHIVARCSGVSA